MDFNTFFLRFGLDSTNFVNKSISSIETDDGFIYEAEEEYRRRICPFCNYEYLFVHTYKWIEINLSSSSGIKETLRIKRI